LDLARKPFFAVVNRGLPRPLGGAGGCVILGLR